MEKLDIVVVGGGPAGLRAAEVAAQSGRKVTLFDAKPGVGRKFLVAGKGGLNLTHGELFKNFTRRYSGGDVWQELLSDFDPAALREWAHGLGQETFQASSGRVYPKALKGAPLLRAWISRLKGLGVDIRTRQKWTGISEGNLLTFEGQSAVCAGAVIFALGGGSWPKTGSDGGWVDKFREIGVTVNSLQASNCGWECDWSAGFLEIAEGLPVKNIVVKAGVTGLAGELMVTRYGLEGGTVYALGRELRQMDIPEIEIDFKPTFSTEQLITKVPKQKSDLFERAVKAWKLSKPVAAMLGARSWETVEELAGAAKSWRITLNGPRPIAEAISSAGGVSWQELDDSLMLRKFPGVFLCGEMIDWDAPTGGYLLQAAFATGSRVGRRAADFVS
ncbi:NAD(P)/FAD-dependent oxidoreductase [Luteolibacter sp. AS25]|uniref:NAD(P)/FAD-dependent oxidoreductase n=1 Tax=Luteolibacter sp. AS25 TaxID=3135776 RepID=UPI00398B3EAA